jgi:hypothetical protein
MTKRLLVMSGFLVAAFTLMIGALGSAVAQGDMGATPEAGSTAHPAHIHSGTCETLGGVVYPLENVSSDDSAATPQTDEADVLDLVSTPEDGMATPDDSMTDGLDELDMLGEGAETSTTTVEAALDDILAAEHAINVHESEDAMQNYVACGDVTGTPDNGELVVTLNELNGSGLSGEATLTDNGDGTTTVEINLSHSDTGAGGMGTPEGTPAG